MKACFVFLILFGISVTYKTLNATKHPSPVFGMQWRLVLLMYDSCGGSQIMYDNVNFFVTNLLRFVQNLYQKTLFIQHYTIILLKMTGTLQIIKTVSTLHTFSWQVIHLLFIICNLSSLRSREFLVFTCLKRNILPYFLMDFSVTAVLVTLH